jgi:TIR domain/Pentapeptide repeats (8 copies)
MEILLNNEVRYWKREVMANEEQLEAAKQGAKAWNTWREENDGIDYDLRGADLSGIDLSGANLSGTDLSGADLSNANLFEADLFGAFLIGANLFGARLAGSDFYDVEVENTIFGNLDLSEVLRLENVDHYGPSSISMDTFFLSKGKIPEIFLEGCGLSDWEIEEVRLYDPSLNNDEVSKVLYRVYDLRATQALQISPLFVSYSHVDSQFVDKIGESLAEKGIRYWRDTHDMKSGRIEKQIDRAIRQNPTVLLVLSEHSLNSDWVEHEVRTARELEKDMGRDVLCPVALDDSWKSSSWPKRIMEQIMEYNILDFSAWQEDVKFEGMFRKLINGLELFYKG